MMSSRHNLVPIRLGIALLVGVATLATATSINMRMGTLWDVYDDNGNEGWGGSALVWPGAIHVPYEATAGGTINEGQASVSYKGFLYGATNFVVPDTGAAIGGFWIEDKDVPNGAGPPAPGDVLPYYVVVRDIPNHQGGDWNGVQLLRSGLQGDADEVRGTEVMLRHPLTEVRVDGVLQSKLQDGSEEAIINPNLGADIVVHQWWRINMGITTHRYLAQNLHEDHDDYIVWHYRFENDGRYNQSNASISHGNQINGFYYSWSTWFMDRAEGGRLHGTTGENRGDNATEYDPGTRMMFGFDRDAIDTPGDDTGDPHPATGEMISARFAGIAVVHADVSTTDRSDDPEQPKRFDYDNHRACIGLKTHGSQRLGVTGQEGPFGFEPLYKSMMWPGGEMRPWTPSDGSNFYKGEGADAGGRWAKSSRELGWPVGDIAYTGGFFTDASEEITAEEVERVNAANTWFSVGGWDIPSGEHINVTWVAAVGGMPRKRAREIAAGQIAAVITEQQRLAEYFDLETELKTIVGRADALIGPASEWADVEVALAEVPQGPPSPVTLDVWSDTDVRLGWDVNPNVEATDRVKILRSLGPWDDTAWEEVADLAGTESRWDDTSAPLAVDLYYRVIPIGANGVAASKYTSQTLLPVRRTTSSTSVVPDSIRMVGIEDGVPAASGLSDGAPNPFNPSTTFTLSVKEDATARVEIFALTGQRVAVLYSEFAPAGVQTLVWNGHDQTGRMVAAGSYLVRAQVGEEVFMRRVTFLK